MYPLLTASVGTVIVLLSAWSLVRAFASGGIFVNQLRFLVSGLLLAFHYPLVSLASAVLAPYMTGFEVMTLAEGAPFWAAVILLVTAQLIILPTGRELYLTCLADRFTGRRPA